jgi:hypothetical protein
MPPHSSLTRQNGSAKVPPVLQIVINIIGRTLQSRKSKKPIHVFGFGDSRTADRCVFTFLPDGSPCRGVRHLLKRYQELTPELVLGGPTNFAPIIFHAIRLVKATGACHILVIIAGIVQQQQLAVT